jgi:hypothetical protein
VHFIAGRHHQIPTAKRRRPGPGQTFLFDMTIEINIALFPSLKRTCNEDHQAAPGRKVCPARSSATFPILMRINAVQVKPLRKQLKGLKAWITGQRKDQSPGTRTEVPVVQVDPVFEGLEGGPGSLIKYNPLSNLTSAEVWNFLRVMVSRGRLGGCMCASRYGVVLVRGRARAAQGLPQY